MIKTFANQGNFSNKKGIYPPGYQERRRQRLLEKYGVEIKPVSADPNGAPLP